MPTDNPALARREELAAIIANNYNPGSVYIPAVACINESLKNVGVGLTENAFKSLADNIKKVADGSRTEAAASLHESYTFTKDTINSMRAGHFGEASITAGGVLLNMAGQAFYFSNYDRERMSPEERARYDSMSPM